jgi:hypothetical protein
VRTCAACTVIKGDAGAGQGGGEALSPRRSLRARRKNKKKEKIMPAYNFKKEFAPMILSGRKPHTIRRRRKNPTKVGDMLYLYTGMRTKACEKIAETPCTRVQPVVIWPNQYEIYFILDSGPVLLTAKESIDLAIADGFSNVADFFDFFGGTYGDPERFLVELDDFEIIYWDPAGICPPALKGIPPNLKADLGGE